MLDQAGRNGIIYACAVLQCDAPPKRYVAFEKLAAVSLGAAYIVSIHTKFVVLLAAKGRILGLLKSFPYHQHIIIINKLGKDKSNFTQRGETREYQHQPQRRLAETQRGEGNLIHYFEVKNTFSMRCIQQGEFKKETTASLSVSCC